MMLRFKSGFESWTPLLALCTAYLLVTGVQAENLPPVFTRRAPASLTEFREMEKHVTALTRKVTPVLVAVQVGQATGSGVVISSDGLVLTVAHVAGRPGREVLFRFSDGRSAKGKTLGTDHGADAGMMRITDPGPWPHLDLAPSEEIHVGDWTLALGHPGGWDPERPVVVRLGRVLELDSDFLHTDCTITAGDSGGPLFDMKGRVVGLHSFVRTATSANYHVRAQAYRANWQRLLNSESWGDEESSPRPWLGTRGVDDPEGCRIERVDERGPAFKAGLQVGDVVLRINGVPVDDAEGYASRVRESKIGTELHLRIKRNGSEMTLTVKVGERGQR